MTLEQMFIILEKFFILIENHWITTVISTGVLYFMFKVANLLYSRVEQKIIKWHSKDLKEKLPKTIEKNSTIHQLLYKALYQLNCDRAYIYEYHNGWHSISGIDFLKASNTFEVVNDCV